MTRLVTFGTLLLWVGTGAAFGGELVPGQHASDYEDDLIWPMPPEAQWQGELLAERSDAFYFEGDPPAEGQPEPFSRGTFTSRVYRDAATGGLAFYHVLREEEELGVNDLERVILRGLGTTPIDLYAERDEFIVNRSADGDTVTFQFNQEHIFGSFLVRTPGTAYGLYPGAFTIEMDFEPSQGNDGTSFLAYAPVPEPSAAAFVLVGGALLLRRRR